MLADFLSQLKIEITDSSLYERVYAAVAKTWRDRIRPNSAVSEAILNPSYGLSRRLDQTEIQSSSSARNVLRAKKLSQIVIGEQGKWETDFLKSCINELEENLYFLGPGFENDGVKQEHILQRLKSFLEYDAFSQDLQKINKPYANRFADQLIRDTLTLDERVNITDTHTRRAVLSACLTYLRQTVGSCFATAPSILVQHEQLPQFLRDLDELLNTGRIKRTFSGIEYAAPLSRTWGVADSKRMIYLYKNLELVSPPIWESPGVLLALAVAGVLDEATSLRERAMAVKELIQVFVDEQKQSAFSISIVDLLEELICRFYEVSKNQLEELRKRPLHTGPTGAMIHHAVSHRTEKQKIRKGPSACLSSIEHALKTFKLITENPLLRAWEFTVASFAETKPAFSKWNFYSSLGLDHREPGGIGETLYKIVQEQLESLNRKVNDLHAEYEQYHVMVQGVEARLERAGSEQELRWLKNEYHAKSGEMRSVLMMRNETHQKASRMSELFSWLVDRYTGLFQEYFQEVYDADIQEVQAGIYDDSPAGFRLLYKHGRDNTSQWTLIHTAEAFIESLSNFFISTEAVLKDDPALEGLGDILSQIVSSLSRKIKMDDFLEGALYRMAKVHKAPLIKNPLQNLDKVEKKPWVYTSGGSMDSLVSTYWRREDKPTSDSRWVESPQELLAFIIDKLRKVSAKDMQRFIDNPKRSMLMHSPTHAFLLKPGFKTLMEGWLSDAYSYTWIKEYVIKPSRSFLFETRLDADICYFLVKCFAEEIDENYRARYRQVFDRIPHMTTIQDLRRYWVSAVQKDRGLSSQGYSVISADMIDGYLHRSLPVTRGRDLMKHLRQIFEVMEGISSDDRKRLLLDLEESNLYPRGGELLSATQLIDIAKSVLLAYFQRVSFPIDFHKEVVQAARKRGLAYPEPTLVADSNWNHVYFGFVVNPGTGDLDFWELDYLGREGNPLARWKRWLDGSCLHPHWGIFIKPNEYSN